MKGPTIMQTAEEEDFSEYVWMGEELEDFDNKIKNEYENEFWEEYFIEMCFSEMLDEEDDEWFYPVLDLDIATLEKLQLRYEEVKSSLNPLAPEFYPRSYSSSSDEDASVFEEDGQQR